MSLKSHKTLFNQAHLGKWFLLIRTYFVVIFIIEVYYKRSYPMKSPHPTEKYSIIHDKNPREIVLLRGSGCKWRRCKFCNYHLDFSPNQFENDQLNFSVLAMVTGEKGVLEVINSGSFSDLSQVTLDAIVNLCLKKTYNNFMLSAIGRIGITSPHFANY